MMKFIRSLTQPLKALYVLFFIAFICGFVTMLLAAALQNEGLIRIGRWEFAALGLVAFFLGLVLVTDFRRGAHSASVAMKEYRPFGVDYSKSFLSSPRYARMMGAGFMVVGAFFVQIPFNPEFMSTE
ncbi:hypothetical protein [Arthrobacter sp. H14]|uniref:hypothetical protein n=1 Tax=Arthrobacter sp. H14 TaxID=1312959 RepID=UPI0004791E8A|nr:hypothetical protein [Arthrobacter sp. H14]